MEDSSKIIIGYSYIRFSSQEQGKGDSLRRQIQERDEWLKKHPNVRLDRNARYTDLGKSGRGEHMHGAMGIFLAALEAKKIRPGSVLIVENLDRLGRLPILKQFTIFLNIINHGVTIVSTMDGAEYSQESLNGPYGIGLLIGSIAVMKRAYDESESKSKRSGVNWKKKREKKGFGTKRVPGWIEVKDGRFHLIPGRVLILRRIYRLTAQGVGKDKIARMLNEEGVELWGVGKQRGREWHDSYIAKLLDNPAITGRFQWHQVKFDDETGKKTRVPVGNPIEDYFPRAIPAKLYEKVQTMRSSRAKRPGRIGDQVRNLFTGMAHCLATGLPMVFSNKNPWFFLRSAAKKAPKGFGLKPWPYEEFESILINFIGELDTSALVDPQVAPELENMEEHVALLKEKVDGLEEAVKRTLLMLKGKSKDEMALSWSFVEQQEAECKTAKAELHAAKEFLRKNKESTATAEDSLSGVKLLLAKRHDPQFRLRLRDELPNLIEGLFVALDFPAEFSFEEEMEVGSLRDFAMTSAAVFQKKVAAAKRAFERNGGRVRVIYVLFRTGIVRKIHFQKVEGQTKINATDAREMVTGRLVRDEKKVWLETKIGAGAYTVVEEVGSLGGRKKTQMGLQVRHDWRAEPADRNMFGDLISDYSKPLSAEGKKVLRETEKFLREYNKQHGIKTKKT